MPAGNLYFSGVLLSVSPKPEILVGTDAPLYNSIQSGLVVPFVTAVTLLAIISFRTNWPWIEEGSSANRRTENKPTRDAKSVRPGAGRKFNDFTANKYTNSAQMQSPHHVIGRSLSQHKREMRSRTVMPDGGWLIWLRAGGDNAHHPPRRGIKPAFRVGGDTSASCGSWRRERFCLRRFPRPHGSAVREAARAMDVPSECFPYHRSPTRRIAPFEPGSTGWTG